MTTKFEAIKNYISNLLLTESARRSLSRIHQHVTGRSFGIITANRKKDDSGVRVLNKVNDANNNALEKDIRDHGYGFIRIKGSYPEVDKNGVRAKEPNIEPSYIVVGPPGDDGGRLKGFLRKHGEKYNQDAVLYKPHDTDKPTLISTSDRDPDSPKHSEMQLGKWHPKKLGDFYSIMRGSALHKPKKDQTPEEREYSKKMKDTHKTFLFEDFTFDFPETELTYFGRYAKHEREKRALAKDEKKS